MNSGKILVCGGAGYIGSHMVRMLKMRGYRPLVLDNLSTGHAGAVDSDDLIVGDVLDEGKLGEVFSNHRIEAVMHFCAKSLVAESFNMEEEYFHNNVGGLRCILRAMAAHKVGRIVFSSSCAVYADGPEILTEESALGPTSPYGRTKLACEEALRNAARDGIDSVSLRYFNAAGACPLGGLGELHDPETHLIPLAIGAALGTRGPIQVFGDDYDTPDGTCLRDYVHVNDICSAHIQALKTLEAKPGTHQVNIGTGDSYSVMEVLDAVERAAGAKVPYQVASRRQGDPARRMASNAMATRLLGWQPSPLSTIRRIAETAVAWHRSRVGTAKFITQA